MSKTIIQLTDEAKRDLLEIPEKLRTQVLNKISYLELFPFMGPQMEGAYKGFRCLLATAISYKVIYKVIDREVIIYYIRHPSRQNKLRVIRG